LEWKNKGWKKSKASMRHFSAIGVVMEHVGCPVYGTTVEEGFVVETKAEIHLFCELQL
jgi:hypothetical protein